MLLQNIRILVVDDQEFSLFLLSRMLKRHGAIIEESSSVDEAINRLTQVQFDILISDIAMPDKDGHELVRILRHEIEATAQRSTPAIAVSAHTDETWRQKSIRSGFQLHLEKPIKFDLLIEGIRRLLKLDDLSSHGA